MLAPHSTQCWQNPASAPVLKMVQVLLNSGHDDRIRKYCCRNWIGQRQNRRGHKLAISSPALLCVYALVHASAGAWGGRTPTLDVFCSCLTNFLFSCLCMNHVCVGGEVLWRPGEDAGFQGTGVAGNCEHPDVDAGNWAPFPERPVITLLLLIPSPGSSHLVLQTEPLSLDLWS